MYFGPGIEADIKSEFWHGDIWQESPLFGQSSIQINQDKGTRIGRIIAIVSTPNGTKLKIQLLYYGTELPGNFTSSLRIKRAQNGELWLSEISVLIDLQNVIGPVDVWLRDTPKLSDNYQFCIREILYSHEGRWKIRDIKLRNQHPSEYIKAQITTSQNIPTLRL
ncbi:hypothetical protein RhiirC2_800797, partial [Rhizophagus irregularis]